MNESKLEAYLGELEKALAGIPVGDRAEILAEIGSHVREARAQAPERTLEDVLAALGPARVVADRYRAERGFAPAAVALPARRNALRTVAIAMCGMFAVTALALTALAWRAWPLVKVSESGVSLLGGAIDVRADDFDGDDDRDWRRLEGSVPSGTVVDAVRIEFVNGKVDVKPSADGTLRWRCRVKGELPEPVLAGKSWTLNMSRSRGARCDIEVAPRAATVVKGQNGKIEFERVGGPVDASLDNGKIAFEPDPAKRYRVDASVRNGSRDAFDGLDGPNAVPVKLALANGKIERD